MPRSRPLLPVLLSAAAVASATVPAVLMPAVLIPAAMLPAATARAAELPSFSIVLQDHRFVPDHLTVPAGQRFLIRLTNRDTTVAEFESYDMKFEKIVVAGATVTVHAGPLHPGTSKFFDDYHPDTVGTVTAGQAK